MIYKPLPKDWVFPDGISAELKEESVPRLVCHLSPEGMIEHINEARAEQWRPRGGAYRRTMPIKYPQLPLAVWNARAKRISSQGIGAGVKVPPPTSHQVVHK